METPQGSFSGWAVLELMGHRKEIGYVETQAFGQAVLFRVDTPSLDEREYELTAPEYVEHQYCPKGTKVKRPASPARSCLVAPGSLYAINPCTEEAARVAIERAFPRPLILVELPKQAALPAPHDPVDHGELEDEDDIDSRPMPRLRQTGMRMPDLNTCATCYWSNFPMTNHKPPRVKPKQHGECVAPAPVIPELPICLRIEINRTVIWPDQGANCKIWTPANQ